MVKISCKKKDIDLRRLNYIPFFLLLLTIIILVTTYSILIKNEYPLDASIDHAYAEFIPQNSSTTYKNPSMNILDIPAKKINVGEIDIAYKILGNGDPLLLISGSANVMDAWPISFLQEMALTHKIIIFDNRGVGNTSIGTQPFTVQQFAKDTASLLEALKIQKADVLGFSMGSFIAQQLTINYPERINKLVLYGSSCGGEDAIPQSPEIVKTISDVVNNRTSDEKTILSLTFPLEWIEANPSYQDNIPKSKEIVTPNTLKKQFNAIEDWLSTDWIGNCAKLKEITIPTLIISGFDDAVIPSENSLIISDKIKGSWLVQINGAGHGLMYQYPQQFSNIVETFLDTKFNQ